MYNLKVLPYIKITVTFMIVIIVNCLALKIL